MLHDVLHKTGNWILGFGTLQDIKAAAEWFRRAQDLATVAASEKHAIYKEFGSEQLERLLQAIQSSSSMLLGCTSI